MYESPVICACGAHWVENCFLGFMIFFGLSIVFLNANLVLRLVNSVRPKNRKFENFRFFGLTLAYVFGKRKNVVFKELKALPDPLGISRYYTGDRGVYERHSDANQHEIGKQNTHKIERKNLNLRTRVKRLARKTICFSKLEMMHDTVIGLLINKVEFGRDIHRKIQV